MEEIKIDAKTYAKLTRMKQAGESVEDVIQRLADVKSGSGVNTPTKMYSVRDVCRLLDVGRTTVFRRIKLYQDSGGREGLGPVYRDGSRKLEIPESTLSTYMRTNTGY